MSHTIPLWAEILIAILLLASALFTLASAWGVVRLPNFFQRLHPPALVVTWSAWCVSLATIVYFSMQARQLELRAWILIILLSITVPITTVLLSRAALFRGRRRVDNKYPPPPPLQPASGDHGGVVSVAYRDGRKRGSRQEFTAPGPLRQEHDDPPAPPEPETG